MSNLSNVHNLFVIVVQLNKRICADMSQHIISQGLKNSFFVTTVVHLFHATMIFKSTGGKRVKGSVEVNENDALFFQFKIHRA